MFFVTCIQLHFVWKKCRNKNQIKKYKPIPYCKFRGEVHPDFKQKGERNKSKFRLKIRNLYIFEVALNQRQVGSYVSILRGPLPSALYKNKNINVICKHWENYFLCKIRCAELAFCTKLMCFDKV